MYIPQSATNRIEGGKINGSFVERSIPFRPRARQRRRLRRGREGARGWRRNARGVFSLFLLSASVVDSRTIRETSGKQRAPFNWANFLPSLEKLRPSLSRSLRLLSLSKRVSGGGRIDIREVSLNSNETSRTRPILDSVRGPSHNSSPNPADPRESFILRGLCSSFSLNYRTMRSDMRHPKRSYMTRQYPMRCTIRLSAEKYIGNFLYFRYCRDICNTKIYYVQIFIFRAL